MKKRGIILIVILLVVVNISTYCGYGRMNRANENKREIELTRVDHIEILKIPADGAPTLPWKKLTEIQASDFDQKWSMANGTFAHRFNPLYKIWVYYTDKSIRKFDVEDKHMREKRYYYYNWKLTLDYFETIYQNADAK